MKKLLTLNLSKFLMMIFLLLFSSFGIYVISYTLIHPCCRLWPMNSLIILIVIIMLAIIMILVFLWMCKKSDIELKRISNLNFIIIILLSFLSLWIFAAVPLWDTRICMQTAYHLYPHFSWHSVTSYETNYVLNDYPNNLGLVYFEAIFFKILSFLRVSFNIKTGYYYFLPINVLMLLLSLKIIFNLIKKHSGILCASFFSFLSIFTLPFFASLTIFYTDYPAMLFISLILREYDIFLDNKRCSSLMILVFLACLGTIFKLNILILVMGISVHFALTHSFKQSIKTFLILWLSIGIFLPINKSVQEKITGYKSDEFGMPFIHWPLMSLNSTGGYTDAGVNYTQLLKKKYSNSKVSKIEWKEYLHILNHNHKLVDKAVGAKISWVYGEGTYQSLKFCFLEPLMQPNGFLSFLYGSKDYYYIYFCTAYNLMLWIFVLILALKRIIKRNFKVKYWDAGLIGLFGNMIFLIIWEANSRYMFEFLPIIIALTSISFKYLFLHKLNYK